MIINSNKIKDYSSGRDYNICDSSFSPFYSTIGLCLSNNCSGINELWFNYNRVCRTLWDEFMHCTVLYDAENSSIINSDFSEGGSLSFFDTDCFSAEILWDDVILFFSKSEHLGRFWLDFTRKNCFVFRGYSLNDIDNRDPDEQVPFAVVVNVTCGNATECNGTLNIENENGRISFNFAFAALNFDIESLINKVTSDIDINKASKACNDWLEECLDLCSFTAEDDYEACVISKAALGLIQNLTKGQGMLDGYVSSFPSRGSYPTHFLWDSCFQNIAYELMNPKFAKDAILCLLDNERCDGKIGQFICSTWIRPHFSQPALVGWATLRYVKKTGDISFLKHILPKLEKNNNWWLTSRITSCGLVCCPHGLETGQDDSPRFDNGTTISVDMNSYLLNQMRCTSKLFSIIGNKEKSEYWNKKSDEFSKLIIEYLYDEKSNMFYDISPDDHKFINVLCCSNLLPLWAGVTLDDERKHMMIRDYLLNSDYFFGDIPFPSVAYSDDNYNSKAWWRGPTWLPIAQLMLEILDEYGFRDEMITAAKRLYNMILKDGNLRELFDSQSGKGLGAFEQGWSCAIFLGLNKMIYG